MLKQTVWPPCDASLHAMAPRGLKVELGHMSQGQLVT